MSAFDIASGIFSGIVVALITHRLIVGFHQIPALARFGMAIVSAAIVLTLVERLYPGSPFRDWAFVMLRVGLALFFLSMFRRCGERPHGGGHRIGR